MQIVATQKFVRSSPKKLREVTLMVKKMNPIKITQVLPLLPKRAARDVQKVFLTAIANAKNRGYEATDLKLVSIQIMEGPRLKRGQAVSRGMWHPIKKRMSHIKVTLEAVEKVSPKEESKE